MEIKISYSVKKHKNQMKVVIIGGVAGGASTAARLRRMDENAEIILIEKGEYVSYANCGLPYYIGGTIVDRAELFVQTVEGFVTRFQIDVRVNNEVLDIKPAEKKAIIKNTTTNTIYTETYDKLVVSTGSEPIRPNLEGIDSEGIFTLRNVNDTDTIKKYLMTKNPKTALVVGGGFIGLEMVENLHEAGLEVTLVEKAPQVMTPVDFSMASLVHQELKSKGVKMNFNVGVTAFRPALNGVTAILETGKEITVDMVILSIGVRPDTKLVKNAGLALGNMGGIAVNEFMQTSDENIYALGDATEVWHQVIGKPALIPLAGPANKQARIVADNILFGNTHKYVGSIGTSIAKVFDLTVAAAGASSRLLSRENIPFITSITHGGSHAGYYPGSLPISILINFSPEDGRLLGAQVVGYDGVDKRIEMLASVIKSGGSIFDLTEMEHAYAPPYSSAKDPVNMAGFVADNILEGKMKVVQWDDIAKKDKFSTVFLDVRTPMECEGGMIEGAINIPVDNLRDRLDEIPKDKKIVINCAVGLRGYIATRVLLQHGFKDVENLSGGYKTYIAAVSNYGD